MQRRTLSRFDEIIKVFRKYDFDKFLGQTTRNKISPFRSDADNKELLKEDFPERLRLMLQELGTTFIKFGQLLSYLPTLDSDIRAELAKLRDKANIPNRDELFDIMRGALPESEMAKIEHVDRVLGAGSFFVTVQVKYDGREIAVFAREGEAKKLGYRKSE